MGTTIKFQKSATSFYVDLSNEVHTLLTSKVVRKANVLIKVKCLFYAVAFVGLYVNLYNSFLAEHFFWLTINYVFLGLTGILMAFNCSHDAVHNTFSQWKKANAVLYYITFNLQGVNATLWKKRHLASHHVFPNVDGCDADIDDNPFLRFSPNQPYRNHHQFQHIYAGFIYCFYTIHWILIKDFMYLSKCEMANLKNMKYSFWEVAEVILLKIGYLSYMIILPFLCTNLSLMQIVFAFGIMHICVSLFFVLSLIISHLTLETEFPEVDNNGYLPYDFYEHQLAVSMDYHPTSKLANWVFGGFNSHSAHHLFPKLPHTLYTVISPAIKKKALKYDLPYNEKTIPQAVVSHFRYLKKLGHKNYKMRII